MRDKLQLLRDNIASVLFGDNDGIDRVVCCLLARGHVLIEDVPGVGKTLLATALARSIDCSFSRVQLTPDLLPSDILGVSVYNTTSGEFSFKRGPVFANIVLADEINRTPPRTQSALLEAMSEATVSADGVVMTLEPPFMVVATQNPFEFEGTYPLPENQLDRFLMRISLGYPDPASEARVLELRPSSRLVHSLSPVLKRDDVLAMQRRADDVRLERSLIDYIVMLANATRKHPRLIHGLSPRGTLALSQACRAWALMQGREYVIPDDITEMWLSVCSHRVVLRQAGASREEAQMVLREALESVPNPA
jgi:MoxR-like ATPase